MSARAVRVSELADTVECDSGVLALVGDHGGISLIAGDIEDSSMFPGMVTVLTEHGALYLDADAEVMVAPVS